LTTLVLHAILREKGENMKAQVKAQVEILNRIFEILEDNGIEDGHVHDADGESTNDTVDRFLRYKEVIEAIRNIVEGE
jgi:hypothetical protein